MMTRDRFEVIRDEFEQAIRCQTAFGGVKATLRLWGETITALEEAWKEVGQAERHLEGLTAECMANAMELGATISERDEAITEGKRLTVEKEGMQALIDSLRQELEARRNIVRYPY